MSLTLFDFTIVLIYLVGTTLLGIWFTRRQRDLQTYFVGDRNVPWWVLLASIVGTETSTVTFLSVPGLAYAATGNMTFLQLALGFVIGRFVIAWLLLPSYFRGELLTAYQVLRQRFGPVVQRVASGLFLLTRTLADGLRLTLTAMLLQVFTGWPIQVSILVMGICMIVYTYLGGMEAVIWIDLIQLLIYVAGAVAALYFIVRLIPGGWTELVTTGEAADKFRILDFSPDPRQPFTLLTGIVGGACLTMATHGTDQIMVQRYLCARSLGQARVALVSSGFVVLIQFALFLLIGVGLYVVVQGGYAELATAQDQVFGSFIVHYLPSGVIGLVVAAVLAAAMSSSLNSCANAFVVDFCRPLLCPGAREQDYLFLAKVMTAAFGLAQIVVALVAVSRQGDQSVVRQVLTVAGFATGIVLGLFLLGLLRGRTSSAAALGGLVVGFLVVLGFWLSELSGHVILAWPWYAPLGATTTVVVGLLLRPFFPATEIDLGPPDNRVG